MKKTRKLLLVALLMFVFAAATGGAYAYWAGTVNYPDSASTEDIAITVGAATGGVTTKLDINTTAPDSKKLVPSGQAGNSVGGIGDNVEYKDYTYKVKWETVSGGSAAGTAAKLTVTATNFTINSDGTLGTKYVKVQYHNGTGWADIPSGGAKFDIIADNTTAVNVQIRVTLLEPENATDYAAVATEAIAVEVNFAVAAS